MAVFVGIIIACNLDRYLISLKIGIGRTVENWKYGDDAEYLILSLLVLLGNDDQMKAVEFPGRSSRFCGRQSSNSTARRRSGRLGLQY